MTDEIKQEIAKSELEKKIAEIVDLNKVEELVKNNEVTFEVNNITYKVKRATYKQKADTYSKKIEKFIELLKNDKYMLEDDIKKLYLKRGTDIDALTQKLNLLFNNRENLMFRLGEAITNKVPENELEPFKKEIDSINKEIQSLTFNKTSLLESSIESQTMVYAYSYLTFLTVEKLVKGKDLGEGNKEADSWIRVWNTWEEFENSEDAVINKASYYVTLMNNIDMTE